MTRIHFFSFLILILAASSAMAARQTRTDGFTETLSLDFDGSIYVENPNGPITLTGTNSAGASISGVRTVSGVDAEAIKEGQAHTRFQYSGNQKQRFVRTLTTFSPRNERWESSIAYTIRVPRTVHVTVVNIRGESLRISNISGNVFIKHSSGSVELTGVTGPTTINTVNGNVKLHYLAPPQAHVSVTSVNGEIEVIVPEQSSFEWQANTIRGEILTSLPFHGRFMSQMAGRMYRGSLNGASTPRIVTRSIMGKAYLLGVNDSRSAAKLIRPTSRETAVVPPPVQITPESRAELKVITQRLLIQQPTANSFALFRPRIEGDFIFSTSLGNVIIGELTGDGRVMTRAGEISIGRVLGSCLAHSGGGSLNLGEILGPLTARTSAGDVLVNVARKGGTIVTEAGNIQVTYSGGALQLVSGGGDINVRQAVGPIQAQSRSGDITIGVDSSAGSQPIEVKNVGGNIVLNLPPTFAADIEATVTTTIGAETPIQSEFAGLEISSETLGDKLKTKATGKINGGGPKVLLTVENGTIHLRSRILSPIPLSAVR